ncbi:hypothetical protein [Actinomadura rubteroloni]|uniref:hypothetical protein n=1 Tax=Actinomadura rubteroloni TaxID=1926885 RepID=UPI0011B05C23|nr:hypothetical protein [Actinomadura rubteroloni]
MSTEHIATNDRRAQLGRSIDSARFRDAHLIVEKNGEPRAVLVPDHRWQEHQGANRNPTHPAVKGWKSHPLPAVTHATYRAVTNAG